jgi:hypothetical protein
VKIQEIAVMPMPVSPKIAVAMAVLALCGVLLCCGGNGSSIVPQPLPKISGPWEFIAVSNDGSWTAIDVALQEGATLVNGAPTPNGQISASSQQIAFLSVSEVSQSINATGFGGNCLPANLSNSLGPGSIMTQGGTLTFTLTENGNVFNVTGNMSGDDTQFLSGTYTPQTGNTCTDPGGTITGQTIAKLGQTFTGTMCPLPGTSCTSKSEFTDTVTSATLSESSSGTATLTFILTGTDNTTFTMTGPVTANAFSVTGTFQGQPITFYGYYEQVGRPGSTVGELYLVNAASPSTSIASLQILQVP